MPVVHKTEKNRDNQHRSSSIISQSKVLLKSEVKTNLGFSM